MSYGISDILLNDYFNTSQNSIGSDGKVVLDNMNTSLEQLFKNTTDLKSRAKQMEVEREYMEKSREMPINKNGLLQMQMYLNGPGINKINNVSTDFSFNQSPRNDSTFAAQGDGKHKAKSAHKKKETGQENTNSTIGDANTLAELYKVLGGELPEWLKGIASLSEWTEGLLDATGILEGVGTAESALGVAGLFAKSGGMLGLLAEWAGPIGLLMAANKFVGDGMEVHRSPRGPGLKIDTDMAILGKGDRESFIKNIHSYHFKSKKQQAKYLGGELEDITKPGALIYKKQPIQAPKINPYIETLQQYKLADAKYDSAINEYNEATHKSGKDALTTAYLSHNMHRAKDERNDAIYRVEVAKKYEKSFEKGRKSFDSFVNEQKSFYSLIRIPFANPIVDKMAQQYRAWGISEDNKLRAAGRKQEHHKKTAQQHGSAIINLTKPMIGNFTIHVKDNKEGMKDFKREVEKALLEIIDSINSRN